MVLKEHQELSVLTKKKFRPWPPPQMRGASGHSYSGASHDFPELEVREGLGLGLAGLAEAGLCSLRGIYMESAYARNLAGAAEHRMEAEPRGPHGCSEARKGLGKSRGDAWG